MYKSSYNKYNRKKKFNTAKNVLVIMFFAVLLLAVAFFFLQDSFIISSDGISFNFSQTPPVKTDTEELNSNIVIEEETAPETPPEPTLPVEITTNALYFDVTKATDSLYIDDLIAKSNAKEISGVVIPIKNYSGTINYQTSLSYENLTTETDLTDAISTLKSANVYLIAEVFTYTDNLYIRAYGTGATMTNSGYIFLDINGNRTLDPYSESSNAYLIEVCKEIESLGFDEILLSGFHFVAEGILGYVNYKDDEMSTTDVLVENLKLFDENITAKMSIALSEKAFLNDDSTFESPMLFAEICDTVYIPVSTEYQIATFESFSALNKGVISNMYKPENFAYINK